ncbi:POPLD-domain-containing protein [Eremomyces bilateralis CBS 781.70]|uniref:POPLD-domain-containing protein n=1 Tax=Eremomyces bilateralis CBS 781.70 TaxID=1392243 RepID=A0A6G1FT30_9PEZI|nr:POPLD-domain-containing protein [Eremomyces bilateralis CBS 781.70]KAF1808831.1 POPLD-domain-containing protein [Eremomyces bilateralis CBS 781.70]
MGPKAKSSDSDSKKRKPGQPLTGRERKRAKVLEARRLSTQTSGSAYGNGEIDVAKFVKAREYEIKALQDGLKDAKKMLSSRAFQEVPRTMRRRTASHNPNRVPKKLRPRAKREMADDNTPVVTRKSRKLTGEKRLRLETVKRLQKLSARSRTRKERKALAKLESGGKIKVTKLGATEMAVPPAESPVKTRKARVKKFVLKMPDLPPAKFRKRQKNKTWLPTHLYHSKRARMTPSLEPLWRFAIPLTPSEKCYRVTHRATTQKGGVAWDMSYMSTISIEGVEKSIKGLLKGLGVAIDDDESNTENSPNGSTSEWLHGTRIWQGWVYERDSDPKEAIAPVTIIWRSLHQSTPTGMDVDTAEKSNKKRQIFIRIHPSAFLQLWTQVVRLAKVQKPSLSVEDVRYEIGSIEVTGSASLEAIIGTLRPDQEGSLSTDVKASLIRLARNKPEPVPVNALLAFDIHDPRLVYPPKQLAEIDNGKNKPARQEPPWLAGKMQPSPNLFDRQARRVASNSILPQSAIDRRKSLAEPGNPLEPLPTDHPIPIIMYLSSPTFSGRPTWTLILPWRHVSPIWRSLLHYPLRTGGTLRLGGLDEKRQMHFERHEPWFPGDFPGTQAGRAWEMLERQKRRREWERRPKGKRTEYGSLELGYGRRGELGEGWACDWEYLVGGGEQEGEDSLTGARYRYVDSSLASAVAAETIALPDTQTNAIAIVRFTMVNKGVPLPCARVYRLPSKDADLRQAWLGLAKAPKPMKPFKDQSSPYSYVEGDTPNPTGPKPGDPRYPKVPGEEDFIGFVTTGNMNLAEGLGTGVGGLLLRKLVRSPAADGEAQHGDGSKGQQLCIVRTAGERFGRLARWDFV